MQISVRGGRAPGSGFDLLVDGRLDPHDAGIAADAIEVRVAILAGAEAWAIERDEHGLADSKGIFSRAAAMLHHAETRGMECVLCGLRENLAAAA
jgi:hypothetical protein